MNGPLKPNRYFNAAVAAPHPSDPGGAVVGGQFETGELFCCLKTGRMWVKTAAGGGGVGIYLPTTTEFGHNGFYGFATAGLRMLPPAGPYYAATAEAYGVWKHTSTIETTGITNGGGILSTGGTINLQADIVSISALTAGNDDLLIRGTDITLRADLAGATADTYEFSVTKNAGVIVSNYPSGYTNLVVFSKTANTFEKMVVANDGVRVTDLLSTYLLGTDGDGDLETRSLTNASSFLTADVTMTTADTLYDVVSVTLGIGTWLVQATASLYAVTTAGATLYSICIVNGTSSAVLASNHATHPAQVPAVANASASCVVVLAASTVIKLQAQANALGRVVRYQTHPANLDNASGIVAVRIG